VLSQVTIEDAVFMRFCWVAQRSLIVPMFDLKARSFGCGWGRDNNNFCDSVGTSSLNKMHFRPTFFPEKTRKKVGRKLMCLLRLQ
jgi:hypothetical protein